MKNPEQFYFSELVLKKYRWRAAVLCTLYQKSYGLCFADALGRPAEAPCNWALPLLLGEQGYIVIQVFVMYQDLSHGDQDGRPLLRIPVCYYMALTACP